MEILEPGPPSGGHCACCCHNLLKLLKPSVGQDVIPWPVVGDEIVVKSEGEETPSVSRSAFLDYLSQQLQFADSARFTEDFRAVCLNGFGSTDPGGIAYSNGLTFEETGLLNINLFDEDNSGGDANPAFIDGPLTFPLWGGNQNDVTATTCATSTATNEFSGGLEIYEIQDPLLEDLLVGSEVKQEEVVGESEQGDESVVNSDTSTVGCGSSNKTASPPFLPMVYPELNNEENLSSGPTHHATLGRVRSSRVRYYCKSCSKGFSNLSSYKSHQIEHQLADDLKPYSCKVCNRDYTSLASFRSHLHRHRECKDCGLQLENAPISRAESRKKTDLLCDGCKSKNEKIQGHNRVIQSILPMGKSHITGRSSRSGTRQENTLIPSAFNPPQVSSSVISEENVNEPSSSTKLYCNECCKTFVNQGRYDSHMESHKVMSTNPFVCPEPNCNAKFGTNHGLKNHRVKHMSSSFACNFGRCPRTFKMKHHYDLHYSTHFKSKQFSCARCGKKFGSMATLKTHEKKATKSCIKP